MRTNIHELMALGLSERVWIKNLPASLSDLVRLIGLEPTLRLALHYGGTSFYVPKEDGTKTETAILDVVGVEAAAVLSAKFGPANTRMRFASRNATCRAGKAEQATMAKQNITLLSLTFLASGAVAGHRAVGFNGAQANAKGQKVLGVSPRPVASGEHSDASVVGTAVIETGGAPGEFVFADAWDVSGAAGRGSTVAALTIRGGNVPAPPLARRLLGKAVAGPPISYRPRMYWRLVKCGATFGESPA